MFLDIKRSYENSLAKMDTLVRKLQEENRIEKLKRLKFQRIAEEIQDRENTIINNLQNKFDAQLIQQTEANRRKIAGEYKYALKVQKQTVKQQMESIVGQNMIIKKLSQTIINTETTMMNQRFTFYKMCHRDTFGQQFMPPRGSGFDLLNKNLLHETVDAMGNNLLKQASRVNANVYSMLERAEHMISDNYYNYVEMHNAANHEVPQKELFEMERVEYNKAIKVME